MGYKINFKEVTYALSEALDFVGIDDIYHGKRVAYMAVECAKLLNYQNEKLDDIITLGMLHDCGVSTTETHKHLINELIWKDEHYHCERGFELLSKAKDYKQFAQTILYHHTPWEELNALDIDYDVKINANLIFLVDRVDALRAKSDIEHKDYQKKIQDVIIKYKSTLFNPILVETFLEVSSKESFWYFLDNDALRGYLEEWLHTGVSHKLGFDSIKEISLIFADIVDMKSNFTYSHSKNVAKVSLCIADKINLEIKQKEQLEIAALLHDLGKLRVDDEILNKNTFLSEDEKLIMNRHGFDSYMILRQIKGFHKISKIASMHHETLDGKGYPYKIEGKEIPIEARILAVADIFQALAQDRPYRKSIGAQKSFEIINEMRNQHKLDSSIVDILGDNLDEMYELAVS